MPALPRHLATRSLAVALPLIATLIASLSLLAAAPARAIVTQVAGASAVGLQPHSINFPLDGGLSGGFANPNGNPVLHSTNTYAIYWDPTNRYHGDWQHLINGFLQAVGSESGTLKNVFAANTQYTDKTNQPAAYRSTFRGAYTDTSKYPAAGCADPQPLSPPDAVTCLTDAQLREQLASFIAQQNLPKGMNSVFYLLTPPGVTVCVDAAASHCSDYIEESKESYSNSFCSYHAAINPGGQATGDANTILYAALPWTAGGQGDYSLVNHAPGFDCQDGGYDQTKNPIEAEKPKEKTKLEKEEFEKKTPEEKQKAKEAEEREGRHQQEPNQIGLGPDGSYDTGLADLIINQLAVEQQNTVTDPLLNSWQDPKLREATDECRNFFASGSLTGNVSADEKTKAGTLTNQTLSAGNYYLNTAFNLAASKLAYPGVPCITGVALAPQFTTPNPVNSGDVVSFDGMESLITLNAGTRYAGTEQSTYPTFTWNFGDGSPTVSGYAPGATSPGASPCEMPWLAPCAASTFHAYQYGGTYNVTLAVTDVGGNSASVTRTITVNGPLPPSPAKEAPAKEAPPSAAAGAGAQSAAGAAPVVSPPVLLTPPVPNPVATAAITSRSLRSALRNGLTVSYSVNEQVAGHFEVLLDGALARRLGIHGPAAIGLPAGSAPEVVIAKAVLVTTKGGHSTVKILFSKRTAGRLKHVRRVSLMLRLIVRSAATHPPATTTVLSTVNLAR